MNFPSSILLLLLTFVGLSVQNSLPSLNITRCIGQNNMWNSTGNTFGSPFVLADCSGPAFQQTTVSACYDDEYIHFYFYAIDNNIYSPYTQCNDHLYNDDVVELFIAPMLENDSPIHNYIELELSPNSVLFASNITNPALTCDGIVGVNYPCSLFLYSATRNDAQNNWYGTIGVPFKILSQYTTQSANEQQTNAASQYRVNFFRIDTPLHSDKEYSNWSCDNSSPACFHKPLYFGYLNLE